MLDKSLVLCLGWVCFCLSKSSRANCILLLLWKLCNDQNTTAWGSGHSWCKQLRLYFHWSTSTWSFALQPLEELATESTQSGWMVMMRLQCTMPQRLLVKWLWSKNGQFWLKLWPTGEGWLCIVILKKKCQFRHDQCHLVEEFVNLLVFGVHILSFSAVRIEYKHS